MLIIGCDYHPGFQQVAIFDNLTGELEEKRLQHRAEAEQFYRSQAGQQVRVGMQACGTRASDSPGVWRSQSQAGLADNLRQARGLGAENISSSIRESVIASARIGISPAWSQFPNPSQLNEPLQIVVQRARAEFV